MKNHPSPLFRQPSTVGCGIKLHADSAMARRDFIGDQLKTKGAGLASAPDGYTLLMAHTGEFAINPAVFPKIIACSV
jgi:hypothetical protein